MFNLNTLLLVALSGVEAGRSCAVFWTGRSGSLSVKVVFSKQDVIQENLHLNARTDHPVCGNGSITRVDVWNPQAHNYWQGKVYVQGTSTYLVPRTRTNFFQKKWREGSSSRCSAVVNGGGSLGVAGSSNPTCTVCTCTSEAYKVCTLIYPGRN